MELLLLVDVVIRYLHWPHIEEYCTERLVFLSVLIWFKLRSVLLREKVLQTSGYLRKISTLLEPRYRDVLPLKIRQIISRLILVGLR